MYVRYMGGAFLLHSLPTLSGEQGKKWWRDRLQGGTALRAGKGDLRRKDAAAVVCERSRDSTNTGLFAYFFEDIFPTAIHYIP